LCLTGQLVVAAAGPAVPTLPPRPAHRQSHFLFSVRQKHPTSSRPAHPGLPLRPSCPLSPSCSCSGWHGARQGWLNEGQARVTGKVAPPAPAVWPRASSSASLPATVSQAGWAREVQAWAWGSAEQVSGPLLSLGWRGTQAGPASGNSLNLSDPLYGSRRPACLVRGLCSWVGGA
jgi:hypothetical protein